MKPKTTKSAKRPGVSPSSPNIYLRAICLKMTGPSRSSRTPYPIQQPGGEDYQAEHGERCHRGRRTGQKLCPGHRFPSVLDGLALDDSRSPISVIYLSVAVGGI